MISWTYCVEATTWMIVDLCAHKEYIEPLRAEIRSILKSGLPNPYDKLYFMDSFMRESSRLNPLDGCTLISTSLLIWHWYT